MNEFTKKIKALKSMNTEYVRDVLSNPHMSKDLCIIMLHKSRYECVEISDDLRQESRAWLEGRGFTRMNSLDFPEGNRLPE